MPLDDLVNVIETIQQRIRDHGDSLRQNEIRTRVALIDPMLTALGWDVADPAVVTAEYAVGNGRADYALLDEMSNSVAFIEAKHLSEPLERPQHEEQVFTYALRQQVRHSGLTDGNRWVLDDVSDFSGERRKLDITIANMPAYQCALKFLLLWRPNLVSGQPVAASEPIPGHQIETPYVSERAQEIETSNFQASPTTETQDSEWVSLQDFQYETGKSGPLSIRFGNGEERELHRKWINLCVETAEFLIREGKLTRDMCPVPAGPTRYIVHSEPKHSDGKEFESHKILTNGTYFHTKASTKDAISYSKKLLLRCDEAHATVQIKLN